MDETKYLYGPYVGRVTKNPFTGRSWLEVIIGDDQVLLKDDDEFVTFMAAIEFT